MNWLSFPPFSGLIHFIWIGYDIWKVESVFYFFLVWAGRNAPSGIGSLVGAAAAAAG